MPNQIYGLVKNTVPFPFPDEKNKQEVYYSEGAGT